MARAAIAGEPGLRQVELVNTWGALRAVRLVAKANHDWSATATALASKLWWFEREPVDLVLALRALATPANPPPVADWARLGETDPRLRAERALLLALEQTIAARQELWDPRLDEVTALAEAWRALWRDLAPQLPAGPAVPLPIAPIVAQLQTLLAEPLDPAVAAELAQVRDRVKFPAVRTWTIARVCHRVAEVCGEVAEHAERSAQRTADPVRAAAYARLAARCRELRAAAELLRGT